MSIVLLTCISMVAEFSSTGIRMVLVIQISISQLLITVWFKQQTPNECNMAHNIMPLGQLLLLLWCKIEILWCH